MTGCVLYFTLSAQSDSASADEKAARKTSLAGGARVDLEKAAQQQQIKLQEQMEWILTSVKATHEGGHTGHNKRAASSDRNHNVNTTRGTSPEHQGHIRCAQTEMSKVTGKVHLCQGENAKKTRNKKNSLTCSLC